MCFSVHDTRANETMSPYDFCLLICAQHELRLVLFDLQFHYIRHILKVKVITATDLVSTDCCRCHAESIHKFRDQHVLEKEL